MLTAVDHNKGNVHYESGIELHYNWYQGWSTLTTMMSLVVIWTVPYRTKASMKGDQYWP